LKEVINMKKSKKIITRHKNLKGVIKWEVVGQADWNQKLNLMFASGDYTDMILRGDVDCDEYGANKGILISLNDYFETYMPNYSALLKYDNITEAMPSTDGKIYYTGYMMGAGAISSGHYFINRTWLDALDLDVPTTIDELTDVFRAFKTKDPNGNGENDEIPYESMMLQTVRGLNYCFSFWGIPENTLFVFVDDNNKVQFTPYQKGYRECIEWLNTLYREGLIDPECISQDNTVYTAKLNTEKCGFFTNWRLTKNGYEVLEDDFECMLPVSAEGYTPVMPRVLELGGFGAALTSTNKHIKESLRWLDAQYETETMFRERFGVLDEHFKLNADGKYEVIVTPENLKQLVPSNEGQFFAPPTWYRNHYVFASHHEEKAKYCDWYEPYLEKTSYNYLTSLSKMTTDEKDTLTKVQTELSKFIEEKLTAFITHGVTDDQWNNFIKTLGDLKAEEYVNLYQNALNKYLGI